MNQTRPLDEFLVNVRKSGLIPEERLGPFEEWLRGQGANYEPRQAADLLLSDGLITNLQAKLLLEGKSRGFLVNNKYKLLELIAVGGMGAVYLCEHILMQRLVAIKVLPKDNKTSQSQVERFIREARAVAQLDHPNIVRAFDLDRIMPAGNYCFIMEYVDGSNLGDVVERIGQMPWTRAVNYIVQAAEGLQHAHEAGWVHRDIKPGNLLLNRQGIVKVLDMGLARLFGDSGHGLTQQYDQKKILGTADYIAPEQSISSSNVDIRADIYSLGATLYYLLAARPPFTSGTTADKLVSHQMRAPDPLARLRPDLPSALIGVVERMMAKNPNDRPSTPSEVVEILRPWYQQIAVPTPAEMPQLCPLLQAYSANNPNASAPLTTGARIKPTFPSPSTTDLGTLAKPYSGASASGSGSGIEGGMVDLSAAPTWRGRPLQETAGGSTSRTGAISSRMSMTNMPVMKVPSLPQQKTFMQKWGLALLGSVVGIIILVVIMVAAYEANKPQSQQSPINLKK